MITSDLPQQQKKPLIELSSAPDEIYHVKLDVFQKEKFVQGDLIMLHNMRLPDGRIVDGKVKLSNDEKGELKIQLFEKKEVLEIPNEILNYKLTDKDKEDLLAEKTVGIKTPTGHQLYIQVDKDLNRVMIKTDRDLRVISEIGNYKLTDMDKQAWVNGEKLPTRIFYDENKQVYFAASIRKTEDGKGVVYENYKSLKDLSPDQIKEMIKEYNSSKNEMLSTMASITNSINTPTEEIQQSTTTLRVDTTHDNDRRFVEYINNKDFEGLKRLASEGYKPEKDLIERTAKQLNMNEQDKANIMTIMKLESKQTHNPELKPGDPVVLTLNNKPYKLLEISENGTKALLEDPAKKKIGVSIEHVRLMSKKERNMLLNVKKNITKEQTLNI